jgi:BolA protein
MSGAGPFQVANPTPSGVGSEAAPGASVAATSSRVDARAALAARLAPFAPRVLEIRDDSERHVGHAGAASGAGHFSLTIVSEHFLGLTRLARHRAILERVGDLIPYPVHALSIDARTPDEIRRDERTKQ